MWAQEGFTPRRATEFATELKKQLSLGLSLSLTGRVRAAAEKVHDMRVAALKHHLEHNRTLFGLKIAELVSMDVKRYKSYNGPRKRQGWPELEDGHDTDDDDLDDDDDDNMVGQRIQYRFEDEGDDGGHTFYAGTVLPGRPAGRHKYAVHFDDGENHFARLRSDTHGHMWKKLEEEDAGADQMLSRAHRLATRASHYLTCRSHAMHMPPRPGS